MYKTHIQISLSALHITLRVFYRLFELLEMDCHELNLHLAQGTETVDACSPTFQLFMDAKRQARVYSDKIAKKKEQLKTTIELDSYLTIILQTTPTDSRLSTVFNKARELYMKIADLVCHILKTQYTSDF